MTYQPDLAALQAVGFFIARRQRQTPRSRSFLKLPRVISLMPECAISNRHTNSGVKLPLVVDDAESPRRQSTTGIPQPTNKLFHPTLSRHYAMSVGHNLRCPNVR